MIKLINCDIDGTLIKNYGYAVEPKVIELIKKFKDKGVYFFAASGRQFPSLKYIFQEIQEDIGYIAENGALISYENKIIFKSKMDDDLIKPLYEKIASDDSLELFLCGETATYMIPKDKEFCKKVLNKTDNHTIIIQSPSEIKEDILKVSLCRRIGLTDEFIKDFSEGLEGNFKQAVSGNMWYDFMNLGVHKGSAIKQVQSLLNITPEQTVAFGDNFNDLEMLQDAKFSYAMVNAHDDVKKVAKYTCENVADELELLYNKFFA